MDKKAIKNFAINARRKLINEVTIAATRLGITDKQIEVPKQIDADLQEIESSQIRIQGEKITQRNQLVAELHRRETSSTYQEAFQELVEEVAYTWFNRLIAIRFMEVNDYLPDTYRILSSEISGKNEPDIITDIYESDIYEEMTEKEQQQVQAWKNDASAEAMDHLYQFVFIKICNQLNDYLPELFEKVEDYTELLFTASYIKNDGVIAELLTIPEEDFDVQQDGQVEIVGWLYQYYNSEPKDQVYARPKSQKIRKQEIPAVTQLFTPDWIVRYMVENSLGRFYIEKLLGKGDPRSEKDIATDFNWVYYLPTAEQPESVLIELANEQKEKAEYSLEDIQFIDPSMGSGHILVYAFDVFMQLYEVDGFSSKEAATIILEKNLFGLDIDKRAKQLAYFALMMKGRGYNRQILKQNIELNVFDVPESAELQRDEDFLHEMKVSINDEDKYNELLKIMTYFTHGKEFGSLINISEVFDYEFLMEKLHEVKEDQTATLFVEVTQNKIDQFISIVKVAQILSREYEIVVTNPPYMGSSGMSKILSDFAKKNYPNSKSDLFAAFMEVCSALVKKDGYVGMITQQAWMFLSSYEKLRKYIVDETTIINMANLGARAFEEIGGEVVQTTTFILKANQLKSYLGTYIRLVDLKSQVEKEEAYIEAKSSTNSDLKFIIDQNNFKKIPGMPIAYWVSEKISDSFTNKKIGDIASARQGIATGNNQLFLKYWYEINNEAINFNSDTIEKFSKSGKRWVPYNKGGSYRKWYGNFELVVNWENNGQEIKNYKNDSNKIASVIRNPRYFFKEGLTWSSLTSGNISFRYTPNGFIFDSKGPELFLESQDLTLFTLLGYMNSAMVSAFLNILAPTLDFNQGPISKIPVKKFQNTDVIDQLVHENITISKKHWNMFETSWDFNARILLNFSKNKIESLYDNAQKEYLKELNILFDNERKIDNYFFSQFGFNGNSNDKVNEVEMLSKKEFMIIYLSYFIGVAFGRYSLDEEGLVFAGGDWDPTRYKKFKPDEDNILLITDEEYFTDSSIDIVHRFIEFVEVTFGEDTLEENLQFIADTLGGKGESREVIRRYFVKDFYKDHLQTYSKRPIYWQLDSGKQNGFKALMYLHRYTPDQLGNVRTEYLHELQKAYDNRIELRQQQIQVSENQKEINIMNKEIAKIQKQLKEIREYDEKLGHLALQRIELDLDDGVIVNYDKLQRDPDTGEKLQILAKGVNEPKK